MKFDWQAILTDKRFWIPVSLFVVLVIVAMYMTDCGSNWSFKRDVKNRKQQIANTATDIKTIETQIGNLQQQRDQKIGELKSDVEQFQNDVYGREDVKRETNRTLANLANASSANASNVNATADDVLKQLEKLK